MGELQAIALVRLGNEVVPAPSIPACAKDKHDERAQGEHIVAHDKVFHVHDGAAGTKGCNVAQDIEAQDAGHHEDSKANAVHPGGLLARPAPHVHAVGDDVLYDANDSGHCCAAHEDEEEAAPEASALHGVEDVGQGDENEARAAVRLHVKGKAGRKDDEACRDGHEGVQDDYEDGLVAKALSVVEVAAEDHHSAHADGQREEGLVHGCRNGIHDACFLHALEVRGKVEGKPLGSTLKGQGTYGKAHDDKEQAQHHDLDHGLKAAAHAKATDNNAYDKDKQGPPCHADRLLQHVVEEKPYPVRIKACHGARGHVVAVGDDPARDRNVEHHEAVAAHKRKPAYAVPVRALGFKVAQGIAHVAPGRPAYGKLHGQDGYAHDQKEENVDQNKESSPVLACDVGEAPHVAKADGTACGKKDKAQA